MSWWRRLIGRWRRSRFERDMAAELQFHLDERVSDLVRQGLSPHEARRRASVEFGGFEGYKENCREAAGWMFLSDLRADVTYGLRRLRQSPGFAAAAILSLALGVGANTLVSASSTRFCCGRCPSRSHRNCFSSNRIAGRATRFLCTGIFAIALEASRPSPAIESHR